MSFAEDLNPRAKIGHNLPPTVAEILADRYADLLAEADRVVDRAASQPKKILDDIALGRLGDVVKDARKVSKMIDAKRQEEVEPHLTAQREINGFMKGVAERVDTAAKTLERIATDYQTAKLAEERRVREAEARRLREEEDRQRHIAEAAAAKNQHGKALTHDDRAEEAAERARRVETEARASAADLTRVRSDTGTVSTTRASWSFAIEDINKIPLESLRHYLGVEAIEKAVRKFVMNTKGTAQLEGVRIFQDNRASFR